MSLRLVDHAWSAEFLNAARLAPEGLRVVSPFIKRRALDRVLSEPIGSLRVITRFNMTDFASGVSDIAALQAVLKHGGELRGIRGLHSKLYIFGQRRAIVTSANLTIAALERNAEFGMVTEDTEDVAACSRYFDGLWGAGNSATMEDLLRWDKEITRFRAGGGTVRHPLAGKDFGASQAIAPSLIFPPVAAEAAQAFVKFLGEGDNRESLNLPTISEVQRAGCHWALAYPASKRPRVVQDGAVMYIARLTSGPNDIRIFGRAVALAHVEGRDDATPSDIELRPWKAQWNRYIRVYDAEFVAGTMGNGISLNELMETLDADSFAATQKNARAGSGNTEPRRAYLQQAAVQLSQQGADWLHARFEAAIARYGRVPAVELQELDWPAAPV
jgi:hypothetical protein